MTKSRKMSITYAIAAAVLGLALSSSYITSALAASPHFIQASANILSNGDLKCSFKLAGLGDTTTTTVTCSASATAVYACQNNGGNFPSDPKKTTVSGNPSASGQFTSGKNGQITGSLTLNPPPNTTLSCPNGQHVVLVSVSYTNVQVSAPGATPETISGTFSKTFFNI